MRDFPVMVLVKELEDSSVGIFVGFLDFISQEEFAPPDFVVMVKVIGGEELLFKIVLLQALDVGSISELIDIANAGFQSLGDWR